MKTRKAKSSRGATVAELQTKIADLEMVIARLVVAVEARQGLVDDIVATLNRIYESCERTARMRKWYTAEQIVGAVDAAREKR